MFQASAYFATVCERLPLAAAADQDRQVLLHGRRVVQHVLRVVEAAARGRRRRRGACSHQLDRLVEPVQPLAEARAELDPEGRVLGLEPGAADPEVHAAAAHVVERR